MFKKVKAQDLTQKGGVLIAQTHQYVSQYLEKTVCCHITVSTANLKNDVSLSSVYSTSKKGAFSSFLISNTRGIAKSWFFLPLSFP